MHTARQFTKAHLALIAMVVAMASTTSHASTTYRITDLGALQTNGFSGATAINNLGQIVGYSGSADVNTRATMWTNGQISTLGAPAEWAYAYGLNDQGVAVGFNRGANQNAVQWNGSNETILQWQTCCSNTNAYASAINNAGVVAGWTDNGASYWENGAVHTLPSAVPNLKADSATGVNNNGVIVGNGAGMQDGSLAMHTLMWTNGQVFDLGAANGFRSSFSRSINDAGYVVGGSFNNNNNFNDGMDFVMGHATLWQNGQIVDLGSLANGQGSIANDINAQGQIVGSNNPTRSSAYDHSSQAVMWEAGVNAPVILDSLVDESDPLKSVTRLFEANSINDSGFIVGTAIINGQVHGYMLTPTVAVPEAATWQLMLLGCLIVGGRALSRPKK